MIIRKRKEKKRKENEMKNLNLNSSQSQVKPKGHSPLKCASLQSVDQLILLRLFFAFYTIFLNQPSTFVNIGRKDGQKWNTPFRIRCKHSVFEGSSNWLSGHVVLCARLLPLLTFNQAGLFEYRTHLFI